MAKTLRSLFPTPNLLRFAIVPVLAFLATITDRNYLADFWHHLARGRAMVEQGGLVDRDLFTFTVANQPLQDVNWLTQIAYYQIYEAGGLALVQLANSLVIALTMLLLVQVCATCAKSLLAGVIASGIAFLGVWEVLTIRPQSLSMLFFVVVFDLLERSERRLWLLVFPPLLVALWANLHGAFPLGIVLVGCFALAAICRCTVTSGRWTVGMLFCLGACVLASFVNPYGWEVYRYVGSTAKIAYERGIAEWVRPGPDRLIGVVWMLSIAGVLGLIAWHWRQTRQLPALRDCLLLGCFVAVSAGSVRMVPWWMLVSAPVLAGLLVWLAPKLAARDEENERPTFAVAGVFSLVMLAVVFSLPGLSHFNPLLGPTRRGQRVEDDLEAVQRYLSANIATGNIYSHFEWGEYLSWAVTPRCHIFMDGRIEIYPDDVWEKYSTVTFGREGWEEILHEYRVDYLIVDASYHGRTGLLSQVSQSSNWHHAFQSRSAVLFVRKGSGAAIR